MSPILIMRIYGHYKFRNSYPEDFQEHYKLVNFMFHGMYGFWTLYNMVRYYNLDKACKQQQTMTMNNYVVIILLGMGPALVTFLVTLLIIILIPMIIYQIYK